MPLKVTFQLSDRDLKYFHGVMAEVSDRFDSSRSEALIADVDNVLGDVPDDAPDFIKERAEKLHALIEMVKDEEWRLEGRDRDRVLRALAYFSEPQDLIPDTIPGIGFLDDAIMVELVVRELVHEIEAYEDFCKFRSQKAKLLPKSADDPTSREEWLGARRKQLQARMRRRGRREKATRGQRSGRSRLSLW